MDNPKIQTLADHHRRMLQEESGIADTVLIARGYYTETVKAELLRLGFSPSQALVPALMIPIRNKPGEVVLHQARPDNPRIKNGKALKYETPSGSTMALDIPATHRHQLDDPTMPLWITEGSKKADALASHDCCAIALLGVWNWRGTNQHGGKTALADWESIALNGRTIYIVFDSDVMTKLAVHKALVRLKAFLLDPQVF